MIVKSKNIYFAAIVLSAVLVILTSLSCSEDPEKPLIPPDKGPVYQNLTQPDHALGNLELCYNERNKTEYERLLDPNFVYYFSEEDFWDGVTPEQWGRSADTTATGRMFGPGYQGQYKVLSIDLTLRHNAASWNDTTPDQGEFPGETWFYKSVLYDVEIVVEAEPENFTFLAQNLRALITVRQSDFEGVQKYRIVEWRDDVDVVTSLSKVNTSTAEITWGQIKSLYYNGSNYLELTRRDHVLRNLKHCYNQRNIVEYERLLDDPDFIFFFSDEDFAGGQTPEQWDQASDIASQTAMFDPYYAGEYRVISINLALSYPEGSWTTTIPDQGTYPGETWYRKSVNYNLQVVVDAEPEDITFMALNLTALFTVRRSEVGGAYKWSIIEWRDDVYIRDALRGRSPSVESSSWGTIKALYRP